MGVINQLSQLWGTTLQAPKGSYSVWFNRVPEGVLKMPQYLLFKFIDQQLSFN